MGKRYKQVETIRGERKKLKQIRLLERRVKGSSAQRRTRRRKAKGSSALKHRIIRRRAKGSSALEQVNKEESEGVFRSRQIRGRERREGPLEAG